MKEFIEVPPGEDLFLYALEVYETIIRMTMFDTQGHSPDIIKSDVCFSKNEQGNFGAFIIESKFSGKCLLVGVWKRKIQVIAKIASTSEENLWVTESMSIKQLRAWKERISPSFF